MGSSSSEHGSISPDSDAQPDAFFEKVQVPKHQLSHLLRYCHCPLSPCGGPLKGTSCSSVAEHLLGHRKEFCREAGWPKRLVFTQCPFFVLSLFWLSLFFLSPLPTPHFPFLVSSSPYPFCLPVLSLFPSPPPGPLISLFPPHWKSKGESRRGEGIPHTLPASLLPQFLFWNLHPGQNLPPFPDTQKTLTVFICSAPDESPALDDRSPALLPEERDPGLFLLRKDSERRAILYRILWEEQNQVASNLQECVVQVQAEERHLIILPTLPSSDV